MDCLDFNTRGLIAYYMLYPNGKLHYTSKREYTGTIESEDSRAVINLMRTCKAWREVFIAIARGEFMREIWHDVVENYTMEWLAENEHYLFLAYCPDITGEAIAYHQTYLWVNEPWRYDQRLVNLALIKMPPGVSANIMPFTKSFRCLFNNECAMLCGDTLLELMLKSRSDEEASSTIQGCIQQNVDKYKCDENVTEKGECYCGASAYDDINEHDRLFWSHTCIKALQVCAFRGWVSAVRLMCDKIIPGFRCLYGCWCILCKDGATMTELATHIRSPTHCSEKYYKEYVTLLCVGHYQPNIDQWAAINISWDGAHKTAAVVQDNYSAMKLVKYKLRVDRAESYIDNWGSRRHDTEYVPVAWFRTACLNNPSMEDKLFATFGPAHKCYTGYHGQGYLQTTLLPHLLVNASGISMRTLRKIPMLFDYMCTPISQYAGDWCPLSDPGPNMMQFMLELMSRTRMKFGRSIYQTPKWACNTPGGEWLCECKTTPLRERMPVPWALAVLESPLCDKIMSLGYCEDVLDALKTVSLGTVQQRHWDILGKYTKGDCCRL